MPEAALDRLQPRPHQVAALAALTRALAAHDRCQLVMACGTGKTLVGRWHAQATAAAGRTLVLVPSLSLLAQTLGEWRRGQRWPFEALVVCSDPSTAAGAAERARQDDDGGDVAAPYWARVQARVTTDPAEATRFLRYKTAGRPQVVFSTYHSAPVVAAAQKAAEAVFDLAICDEAHRLAGAPREEFRAALDRRAIVAHKRVFMTATPKAFDDESSVSMSDTQLFGPVAHTVSFREAIDAGLLADYRVLVIAGRAAERATDERGPTTVPSALVDAAEAHGIRRVLSFHGRVAKAKAFAEVVDCASTPGGLNIRARHLSSVMSTEERTRTLGWLAGAAGDRQVRLVANARCLTEGIDVPAIDAVLFADQRNSPVDILQAIGRALRPAPGKTHGTIIVPVTLPEDGDDDTSLSTSAFGVVWAVLRGLRAHDERLAEELDRLTRAVSRTNRGGAGGWRPERIAFQLPFEVDQAELRLRLVQEAGSSWERYAVALEEWAWSHNGKRLPRLTQYRGIGIGEWAVQQRALHADGRLPVGRVERLEQIPGWYWDRGDADWQDSWHIALSAARAHGTVLDVERGESRYAGLYSSGAGRRRLGVWLADQRQLYRDGMLSPERAEKLEQLPGWTWNFGLSDDDVAMVQALRLFVEFERHANVPDDHVEEGRRLGAWCWAIRRRKLTGNLAPALEDEIVAATPAMATKKSTGTRWLWHKPETQWRVGYFALRQYVAREGATVPTYSVVETLPDTAVRLGQWCALQRFSYRNGTLEADRIRALEAIPGWVWVLPEYRLPIGEPIDLGNHPHGTAKGVAAKCPCGPCRQYVRDTDRRYAERRKTLRDPVAGGPARTHLTRLENAGAKRTVIAGVARVPLGVVRKLAAGEMPQLEREHADKLLALTVAAALAASGDREGSRGRRTSTFNENVSADPTRQLLGQLRELGYGPTRVARELGYMGNLPEFTGPVVSRRLADAVAELHARVASPDTVRESA